MGDVSALYAILPAICNCMDDMSSLLAFKAAFSLSDIQANIVPLESIRHVVINLRILCIDSDLERTCRVIRAFKRNCVIDYHYYRKNDKPVLTIQCWCYTRRAIKGVLDTIIKYKEHCLPFYARAYTSNAREKGERLYMPVVRNYDIAVKTQVGPTMFDLDINAFIESYKKPEKIDVKS